jgi:predicted nucleic-acid-binding protein
MIGIDTNVLIRYLTQDDERQSTVANEFFESEIALSKKGFVCSVVLCEVVWVLRRCYAVKRHVIADIISKLLLLDTIEVEHGECALRALPDFTKGPADFSDYYLARVNKEKYHAATTVTFDRSAAKSALFRLLKA